MARFLSRRLLAAIPVLLLVSMIVFGMLQLVPGDPALILMGVEGASPEAVERVRAQLGLNDPLHVQYLRFLSKAVRGDLGQSIYSGRSVTLLLLEQLPSTLELTFASMAGGLVLGVIAGVLAAIKRGSWLDNVTMLLALGGVSVPQFWLGLVLIYFFSVRLRLLPSIGQGGIEHLIMPTIVLGSRGAALIARLVRSCMLEVLAQPYVITARAKGLVEKVVILRHALRNALIPVVTMTGLEFGRLLAGAVIVEVVFSRQGIGRLTVSAIIMKDFPLVQGAVLFMAIIYLLVNLSVDVAYVYIDPRIKYAG